MKNQRLWLLAVGVFLLSFLGISYESNAFYLWSKPWNREAVFVLSNNNKGGTIQNAYKFDPSDPEGYVKTFIEALNAWKSIPGSSVRATFVYGNCDPDNFTDRINCIGFSKHTIFDRYKLARGATSLEWEPTREIREADIMLDDRLLEHIGRNWNPSVPGKESDFKLYVFQSFKFVIMHELGHAFGLDEQHYTPSIMNGDIYNGLLERLFQDEMQGMRYLYPAPTSFSDFTISNVKDPGGEAEWMTYVRGVSQTVDVGQDLLIEFTLQNLGTEAKDVPIAFYLDDNLMDNDPGYRIGAMQVVKHVEVAPSQPETSRARIYPKEVTFNERVTVQNWDDPAAGISFGDYYVISAIDLVDGIPNNNSIRHYGGKIHVNGFVRYGDVNNDRKINSADIIYLSNHIYKDGPAPYPMEAGDANCDGYTNVPDIYYLVDYVFKGGPAPCGAPQRASVEAAGGMTLSQVETIIDTMSPEEDDVQVPVTKPPVKKIPLLVE